ncbi:MAG: hypothetical protein IPK72_22075 [Candidatus Eisenbacteria bacterium]|nr:hypothetical protein [Candidatus Eisenbacteria bacterium]
MICAKALEKDPPHRYQSMRELEQDLQRYLAHEPIRARQASALRRGHLAMRRHPVISVGILAVLAITTTLAIANLVLQQKNKDLESARSAEAAQAGIAKQRTEELQGQLELDRIRKLQLAEQRGDWDTVLLAAETNSPESNPGAASDLLMRRARAAVALSDLTAGEALLQRLARFSGDDAFRAKRRLLAVDLNLLAMRSATDPTSDLPANLEEGLEGADLCYARALLASDTVTAGRELAAALDLDPNHYGASMHELTLLVLQGNLGEAGPSSRAVQAPAAVRSRRTSTLAFILLRSRGTPEGAGALEALEKLGGKEDRLAVEACISILDKFDETFTSGVAIGDPSATSGSFGRLFKSQWIATKYAKTGAPFA